MRALQWRPRMTRRQRWYLGHSIAYLPLLCVALYVAFCSIYHYEVSGYVGPAPVLCCILFFVGLMIRDVPAKKGEYKPQPEPVILPIRQEGKKI